MIQRGGKIIFSTAKEPKKLKLTLYLWLHWVCAIIAEQQALVI